MCCSLWLRPAMEPSKFEVAAPAAPAMKSIKPAPSWSGTTSCDTRCMRATRSAARRALWCERPGSTKQMLAIMGPSGSGKTSLQRLGCPCALGKHALLTGSVLLNGHDLTAKMAKLSAYVEQHEALFALSTVRETPMFTAQLRLPSRWHSLRWLSASMRRSPSSTSSRAPIPRRSVAGAAPRSVASRRRAASRDHRR